jgi:hypothetical protein
MDWSINYLSGQHKFLNKKLGWVDVVDNPISKINAHGHKKNHPVGFKRTVEHVKFLQQQTEFATVYPTPLTSDLAAVALGESMLDISLENWKNITEYCSQDYNQMLQWLDCQHAKIVFVSTNKSLPLYANTNVRSLEKSFLGTRALASVDEVRNDIDKVFFKSSVINWADQNLTNIWDTRERLALDTRPFDTVDLIVNFSFDHYWIDCQDLWFNGTKKIIEILKWAEIELDQSRLPQWSNVYQQWQQVQLQALEFQFNYQHIVDCVVNGWSYPINLTFDQEVVIQHCLIYQHNLNLKTWQLEKFPTNTQLLHQLLESNIHPVANIY